MTQATPGPAGGAPAGSIYDLGYQRYEGARLGRPQAIEALFVHSLRAVFGIGRGGRAKIVPIGLALLAVIPAIIAVGFQALLGGTGAAGAGVQSPIRYDTYYSYIQTLIMLFVAAQAPELLGRDQRYHVLSLYFSRALRRTDYALAKAGALVAGILVVALTPQAIIFVGLTLSGRDVPAAFRDNVGSVPPVILVGIAIALLLGSIGLVIAAFTPRRAYATAAIIAVFLIPQVVAQIILRASGADAARYVVVLSPAHVLDGLNAFLFDVTTPPSDIQLADLPGELYLAATAVVVAVLTGVLLRRYQRIAA